MISQDYTGQTVFITGGASGIGLAQVKTYLEMGATVWALDQQTVPLEHPCLTTYKVDLSDTDAITNFLEQIDLSQIDVFLSTAGILDAYQPALATDYSTIQHLMQVDLMASVQLTLALLPSMVQRRHGTIVYMASIASQIAGGGGAAYTMAKHGLLGWMKQLALDYAPAQIHINAIAPGAIKTPMNQADFDGDGEMGKSVAEQTPAKRWASAQEVADATVYLTSPEARYVQGQLLVIDGGWTIQ